MTEKEYEALPEESRKLLFVAKLLPIDDKIEYCKWNLFAPSAAGSRDCRESGGASKRWYQEFDEYSKVRLSRGVLRTLVQEADAGGWWPTEETLRSHLGPEIVREKRDWWLDDYLKVRLDTIRLVRAMALGDETLLDKQDSDGEVGRWSFVSDSYVAAVALAMGALAEEPLWKRLCLRDAGIALVEEWLTQAIFSGRDVRDTLECLRRHYGEYGTENTRLKQTYCAYCVWRGWRVGLELPALDPDPFAQGCRLILAGDLAKAHKLLFKFGDEGYRGDFATSLLIHAVYMAVKPSISRAVKIMKGDYYHSLDRFDEGRITEVRRLQDLHADVTELWSRQWGAGGAYLETNYFRCPMSMDGLHNVLRFAWDWSSKNNTARASSREVAKRLLPFIVRVVENGYVNLGGLFLSLMPELGAESPSEPIKAAMKESGSWILPYQEAKPVWAQFLASLRNVLGVEPVREPQTRASVEEAPAVGRIVWELSGGVREDGYVHLGLPQPYHRVLRPDGTEESALIRLRNIPSQKYRSAVNAQDMALSAKLLAQERGLWRLPSDIAEALCGMPNLELVEGGNEDPPVRTPIRIEACPCQMVSRVAEDGSTVLSLPSWRHGDDYALTKTDRPGVLAFRKLDERTRKLVEVFGAYGRDGKVVLPPEAAALNGDVLERLGEVLPTEKLAEKAEEDLPEVKAKGESVVRLEFKGRCLVINVLVRPVKGVASILFEPGFGPEKRQVEGEKGPYLLVRDLEAERALFAPVRKALATFDTWFNGRSSWQIDDLEMAIEAVECLETMTPKPVLEWNKDKKLKLLRPKVKITADGKSRGWFNVGGTFSVDDGKVHDIMELLAALQATGGAGRYVRLAGGEYVLLTEEIQRQLRALAEVGRKENGKLRIARAALPFLATMFGDEGLSLPAAMEKAAQMVRSALASTPEPPKTLAAQLRPYQLEGYRWLSRLASCGFGSRRRPSRTKMRSGRSSSRNSRRTSVWRPRARPSRTAWRSSGASWTSSTRDFTEASPR